jgi:hypothetical protein
MSHKTQVKRPYERTKEHWQAVIDYSERHASEIAQSTRWGSY